MSPGLEPEHRDKPGHPPYRSHSPTLPASVIGTPAGTKVVRPWGAPPWPHRRSVKRTRPQSRPYLTTEEKNLYHASLTGVPATDKRIMTASWASRRKFTCSQLPAPDPVASCSSGAEPSGIASRVVLFRGAAIAPPPNRCSRTPVRLSVEVSRHTQLRALGPEMLGVEFDPLGAAFATSLRWSLRAQQASESAKGRT